MSTISHQQSTVKKTNASLVSSNQSSDDTRLALLEKAVNSNSDSIKDGLHSQTRQISRITDSLDKIRDRMEQSFDMMSKNMLEINATMYKQGFQMIHYFRWYTIMGIVTVVAVCVLAGSNFYFKWKEVELRSGTFASEPSDRTVNTVRQTDTVQHTDTITQQK